MTKEDVLKIANLHIEKMNQENPHSDKMKWVISELNEYKKGYYFEYEFELINLEEDTAFGGAPGFMVSKENSLITDISWQELQEIKKTVNMDL